MNTTVSRRDFLKIVFSTASAAVLTHPLSLLWPEEAIARPLEDPYVLERDDLGYLFDPDFDWDTEYPTVRDELEYDKLSLDEKLDVFEREIGLRWMMMDYANKPISEWNEDDLAGVEIDYDGWLNNPRDPEYMSFHELAMRSCYWPGVEIYNHLGDEKASALGLAYIEGDHPGSSFCAVHSAGDLANLNKALTKSGLNMLVR